MPYVTCYLHTVLLVILSTRCSSGRVGGPCTEYQGWRDQNCEICYQLILTLHGYTNMFSKCIKIHLFNV